MSWWAGDATGRDPGEQLNELRRSIAYTLGADLDTWPSHGNAGLAMAAVVTSWKMKLEEVLGTPDPLHDKMRAVIDELCADLWGGDLDGGDVQDILERHGLLVEVLPTPDYTAEWGEGPMLAKVWAVVNEHEPGSVLTEVSVAVFRGEPVTLHCRWCKKPHAEWGDQPCVDRLASEEYDTDDDDSGPVN